MGKRYSQLTNTATEADLVSGSYLAIDTAAGGKKLDARFYDKARFYNAGEAKFTAVSGSAVLVKVPTEINPGDKFLVRVVGDSVVASNTYNLRTGLFGEERIDEKVETFSTINKLNKWYEITANYKADYIRIDRGSASADGTISLQVISKKLLYKYIFDENMNVLIDGKIEGVSFDMSGATTGYYYNPNGVLAADSGSSYKDISLGSSYAGKKLSIQVPDAAYNDGRMYLLVDGSNNIKEKISNIAIIDDYNRKYVFSIVPQNGWTLKCSWRTSTGAPAITSIDSYTPSLKESVSNQTFYISPSGSDANDGSHALPKKTINGAIKAGAKTVIMLGGTYTDDSISTSNSAHDRIEIKGAVGERVVVKGAKSLILNDGSEGLVSGYSNVYKKHLTTAPYNSDSGMRLFFDGCPDESTEIEQNDAHPLERGLYYRCDTTKCVRTTASTLSDALAEIESADSYKWFYDTTGKDLYFSRPGATSTYPLHKSTGNYFVTRNDQSILLSNIEFRYSVVNLTHLNLVEVYNCSAKYIYGAGGFVYDDSISVLFDHCEACGVYVPPSGGDGFNGHVSAGSSGGAKYNQVTLRECWSHDNNDDGYSDHEYAESTVDGGLYEYNGKGGVTPSFGSHCVCKNVTSRRNLHGFYYPGPVHEGNGGQMMCYCCVSEGHKTNGGDGFKVDGAGDRAILVGCKSIEDRYAFNCGSGCYMDIIDCGCVNPTSVAYGEGTIIKIKTVAVE